VSVISTDILYLAIACRPGSEATVRQGTVHYTVSSQPELSIAGSYVVLIHVDTFMQYDTVLYVKLHDNNIELK